MTLLISLVGGIIFAAVLYAFRVHKERKYAKIVDSYVDILMQEGPGIREMSFRRLYIKDKDLSDALDTALRLYLSVKTED